jgi:hypothetical protein
MNEPPNALPSNKHLLSSPAAVTDRTTTVVSPTAPLAMFPRPRNAARAAAHVARYGRWQSTVPWMQIIQRHTECISVNIL